MGCSSDTGVSPQFPPNAIHLRGRGGFEQGLCVLGAAAADGAARLLTGGAAAPVGAIASPGIAMAGQRVIDQMFGRNYQAGMDADTMA